MSFVELHRNIQVFHLFFCLSCFSHPDLGRHSLGFVLFDRRREWTNTNGHRLWHRPASGTPAQQPGGQSSGMTERSNHLIFLWRSWWVQPGCITKCVFNSPPAFRPPLWGLSATLWRARMNRPRWCSTSTPSATSLRSSHTRRRKSTR